ncbi:MFS transporter [Erythrobacter litoralis]|uniref:Putative membrane protein n=1 Tax=Erythrobacter litoralis (strain HTCC2594) TaxID=314225 RepID=Q2NAB3_ERYLH|nr:MFS transporter [Erythrobacter litoralis]ABC63378.1 putative membrane protein [Erythrobacter litoralis HTCC2594]
MADDDSDPGARAGLSRADQWWLALLTGVTVANAYYIHPIIAEIGQHFDVSPAQIGLVPAFNQIALALGIFLLLPLGDRISNRTLSIVLAACQTGTLVVMALAQDFVLFVAASTLLGFVTIVPYLLPAYASKRVPREALGKVTGVLTAGIIVAILVARVGAGLVAEWADWRWVYWIAAALMASVTCAIPFIMEGRAQQSDATPEQGYFALVGSTLTLLAQYPRVALSGAIQALNFGMFLIIWLGLAFHLTSPEMGYGTDTVGYLAAIAIVSIYATPRLSGWADSVGPYRARVILGCVQAFGILLYWPTGSSLWLLLIPLIITNIVGPTIDVAGRMTFLSLAPEIRTRLMTGYIIMMFGGAGIASWAAPVAYDLAGWNGIAGLCAGMSLVLVLLSWLAERNQPV